jgi:hypothetical protein
MIFDEMIFSAVADAVFGYLLDKEGTRLSDWVREKLGREPTKLAFKAALGRAVQQLQHRHPEWIEGSGSIQNARPL